ncbi:MAG: histidine phosphatase family protein [Rhodobacterales bacterium]|nr:MAG: histidine phosphatase family protein [Rhodobacterales bacterium]
MTLPEIIVIRHGQTEWNAERRWQGALDSPLTAQGRAQAVAMGRALERAGIGADTHAAWRSPQGRVRETAELCLPADLRAIIVPDLMEIGVGEWSGRTEAEIFAANPAYADLPMLELYQQAPGGEGLDALWKRAGRVLARLRRPTILLTHGITSRFLRTRAMGWNMDRLTDLPGGQGRIFRVSDGEHSEIPVSE